MQRQRAEALVARGFAYYVDEEQTAWRYTWKGAFAFYFIGVWGRPLKRFLRTLKLVRE